MTASATTIAPPSAAVAPPAAGPVPGTIRVAMAIGSFRPVLGGAQLQLEHLGPLLSERGVRATVLTRRTARSSPRRAREGSLDVLRLPAPGHGAASSLTYAGAAVAWVAAARPDVVHAHGLLSPATVALGAHAATGVPVVVKVLSSGPHGDVARLGTKPGGTRRLRAMRRSVAAFVCVSEDIADELTGVGIDPSRIVRIPNGVDLRHFRPACPSDGPLAARRRALGLAVDGPLIVSCGRFDRTKRLDRLVAAMPHVPGSLLLVGDGPEQHRLATLARAIGVGDRVALRGTVEDPAPILRAADLYVSCSEQDGLSNATLEAMACGLPVAAGNAGGMRELVDDTTGVVLPHHGPPGDAIAVLLGDRERLRAAGRGARARVQEHYDLETTADRLSALYRRVAA